MSLSYKTLHVKKMSHSIRTQNSGATALTMYVLYESFTRSPSHLPHLVSHVPTSSSPSVGQKHGPQEAVRMHVVGRSRNGKTCSIQSILVPCYISSYAVSLESGAVGDQAKIQHDHPCAFTIVEYVMMSGCTGGSLSRMSCRPWISWAVL